MSTNTIEADPIDVLVPEIERYLGIVEYFRSQGCEPCWSSEAAPNAQTDVGHTARLAVEPPDG